MSKQCSVFLALLFFLFLATDAFAAEGYKEVTIESEPLMVITDAPGGFSAELFPTLGKYPDSRKFLQNGAFRGTVQTFLLRRNGKVILVDAGWGSIWTRKGETGNILQKAGIPLASVTDILITHLDVDHISGLLDGDALRYPKATLWITASQYKGWVNGSPRGEEAVASARKILNAYKSAGHLAIYKWGDEVLPGIVALQADGHTPGHTVFAITFGKKKLYLIGDLLHAEDLQFAHPECNSKYDYIPDRAAHMRKEILSRCVRENCLIGGAHFTSIGTLRAVGDGFAVDSLVK